MTNPNGTTQLVSANTQAESFRITDTKTLAEIAGQSTTLLNTLTACEVAQLTATMVGGLPITELARLAGTQLAELSRREQQAKIAILPPSSMATQLAGWTRASIDWLTSKQIGKLYASAISARTEAQLREMNANYIQAVRPKQIGAGAK